MAGSSVAAMVVGTVFIMIFGLATVSLVESVNESIKNADYELPEPQVEIVSITDKQESTGPIDFLTFSSPSANNAGTGYTSGTQCDLVSAISGTGASVNIITNVDGEVTGFGFNLVHGTGYTDGETVTIDCGTDPNSADFTVGAIHDQNTIEIRNSGSETVDLSHILITFSNTATSTQGTPFTPFVDHYSGTNLYLFPGEQISTDSFPLSLDTHGFAIGDDPDRAFLAIYDYNDAESVTIT
ncbi:MAG: hypothetical protein VYA39_00650 [Candidatus Thermoplasmatota archaeon]|nr:hypothetical protein [Candidatus Thermoplasmatota archaeon]